MLASGMRSFMRGRQGFRVVNAADLEGEGEEVEVGEGEGEGADEKRAGRTLQGYDQDEAWK